MTYDGSLTFDTAIDSSGFNKGTTSLSKQANGLKGTFLKLGKIIGSAFAVTQLVKFSKEAVELASDIQEVQNVVDTAFGDMKYKMEAFAETAIDLYGISKLTAKETGSTFMAMADGMGLAKETASDIALQLTALSADMSSFYNKTQDITSTALKSVFTGETETLKQFGIVMTEANLEAFRLAEGIETSYKQMSQAEKVALRYNFVMQQTRLSQGDFTKTQDSWANQTRILSERWKEFLSVLGNGLVKVLTPLVKVLNEVLQRLISFASTIGQLLGVETEQQEAVSSAIGNSVENQEALTKATEETTKANKKTLASFDEIQKLTSSSNTDSTNTSFNGGVSFEVVTPYNFDNTSNSIEKLNNELNPLNETLSKFKDISFDKLKKSFEGLGKAIKPFGKIALNNLKWFLDEILHPLSKFTIEEVLPRFIDSLSIAIEVGGVILEKFSTYYMDFYNNFLKPIGEYTAGKFLELWDKFNVKFKEIATMIGESEVFEDLRYIFNEIYKVLEPIVKVIIDFVFWLGEIILTAAMIDLKYFFKDLEDLIGGIADLLRGDFSGAWQHFKDLMVDNKIDKAKEHLEELKNKITEVSDWIKNIFSKENLALIAQNLGKAIGTAVATLTRIWNEKIVVWFDTQVKPWFTLEKWISVFTGIKDAMSDIINKVMGFFTEKKWKDAGKNLYNGLAENINKAITGLENLVNSAIEFFNNIIKGYNSIANEVPYLSPIDYIDKINLSAYKIPRLATGTVVPANYGEFAAVLGDNKRETEVVSPLSTMKQALIEALAESGQNITIKFEESSIGDLVRLLKPYIDKENRRIGSSTRVVGGAY